MYICILTNPIKDLDNTLEEKMKIEVPRILSETLNHKMALVFLKKPKKIDLSAQLMKCDVLIGVFFENEFPPPEKVALIAKAFRTLIPKDLYVRLELHFEL